MSGESFPNKSDNPMIHAKSDSSSDEAVLQHVLSPMNDLIVSKLSQELSQFFSGDDPPNTVSWYGLLVYIRTYFDINFII